MIAVLAFLLLDLIIVDRSVLAATDAWWPPRKADPCAEIAAEPFVPPSKVLKCFNWFHFNSTIRDNIVEVTSKTLNFHTSVNYQLQGPPPFTDLHVDIHAELSRINRTSYRSDYDLHIDIQSQVARLYDGHCVYTNYCYDSLYTTYLPFPLVLLNNGTKQNIYIAPEAFDVVSEEFPTYVDTWQQAAGYNFSQYSGAKVIQIDGLDPWFAVNQNAARAGGFQGLSSRQNGFFSSYRRVPSGWSYQMGDFAVRPLPPNSDSVRMRLLPQNSTKQVTIVVPFISQFSVGSVPFQNASTLWENNCLATSDTNGVDLYASTTTDEVIVVPDPIGTKYGDPIAPKDRRHPISMGLGDGSPLDVSLPKRFEPATPIAGAGTAWFYIEGKVGVLALGSFSSGSDYDDWFTLLTDGLLALGRYGATHLIIDVTNNSGGYVCVAEYLHRLLAGPGNLTEPNAGFDNKARYNALASNITQTIAAGIPGAGTRPELWYDPINWMYGNSSGFWPPNANWMEPPVSETINGRKDAFTQKMGSDCSTFPVNTLPQGLFEPGNIGIVNNGRCASSCTIFSISMKSKHRVRVAVAGGRQDIPQQYAGTIGGQNLNFATLNTEIKSTKNKGHPLAPPDFITNSRFGITWRLGFGLADPSQPEEWLDHQASDILPLTFDNVNRPEAIWRDVIRLWWPDLAEP